MSFTTHNSSLNLDFYTYAYIVVQPCKMCDIGISLFEMFLFRSIISHLHIHVSASRRIHCDVIYWIYKFKIFRRICSNELNIVCSLWISDIIMHSTLNNLYSNVTKVTLTKNNQDKRNVKYIQNNKLLIKIELSYA